MIQEFMNKNTNSEEVTAIVKVSPWPTKLPVGTKIKSTTPRPEKIKFKGSMWFVREDGKLLFDDEDDETDGKFRLMKSEYEITN